MDKVNLKELIADMSGNGKITNLMVMEYLAFQIIANIKDNGFKEIKTETANKFFHQVTFIMVNILTIYNMDMDNYIEKMVLFILGILNKEKKMDLENGEKIIN